MEGESDMQNNKQQTIKLQIFFSVLILAVLFVAEFYAMINYPQQYIIIAVFAVLILLCLFYVIKGLFEIQQIKDEQRREEYDSIIKSQKASYLLLKKYFELINDKVDVLQASSKVPTDEIVSAQKGIAKVLINRSRENAEALMNSNDLLMEQIEDFNKKLNLINQDVIKNVRDISQDNYNQTLVKQQDIISDIKDMELHISQAIMQTQQIISSQPVQLTANVEIPHQAVAVPMSMQQMPMVNTNSVPQPQFVNQATSEPVVETPVEPVVETPVEPVVETPVEQVVEELPIEPVVEEALVEPVLEEALVESVLEEVPVEPVAAEEPAIEEPVAEEKPPMPDMSDPNKKMSPDEIAALFANMGGGDAAPAEEIAEEPAIEEPVVEEKPPMPDMSDPNKTMSPDEIAALIANMT